MAFPWARIRQRYESFLWDGIVPFWFEHGVDREFGGVLSCMTEEGRVVRTEKYMWSQWRWVWMLSRLYARSGRVELIETADAAVRFLLDHGRDEQGRWYFALTREGRPFEGPTSIFADCFAIYGLSEYCRSRKDARAMDVALATYRRVRERVEQPDFAETAPEPAVPGRRIHSIPMILLEVSNELAITTGDATIARAADEYAARILDKHVRPELGILAENLDWNYGVLPPPDGTMADPGHAIESMWFVLHWAQERGDGAAIRRAVEVIRWHIEKGWDPEYGGIFLEIDARGGPGSRPNAAKKVWWPHTEALYALPLAGFLTGESWCEEWFTKVEEWSFRKFLLPDGREWRQRLDRAGQPVTDLIALPVKDPFHLPRAVSLLIDLAARAERDQHESPVKL